MDNRTIIRKAAIETGSLSSGLLNPEQARRFIQQTFDATNLGGLVRHEMRNAKTGEVDKIGIARRILRKKTENTDDGYRAFLVDTFLNAAYLYDDDKLVLVLNYTGERCKVTLELVEKAVEGDPGGSCFAPSGAFDEKKGKSVNTEF